jgi:hypothetical protein
MLVVQAVVPQFYDLYYRALSARKFHARGPQTENSSTAALALDGSPISRDGLPKSRGPQEQVRATSLPKQARGDKESGKKRTPDFRHRDRIRHGGDDG